MSDSGVFQVHRGIFDHPFFAPEAFTEREAWLWMISAVAWKAKRVRCGRKIADLQRGQLIFSERFLAEKWGWSKSSVRRFLDRLQGDEMVALEADRDATLITICNYDRYAFGGTTERTADEPLVDHSRTKEEELNNSKQIDDDVEKRAGSLVSPEALILAEKLLVIAGHSLDFWPPGWCGAPMRVQTWLSQGWQPEIIVAAVKGAAARKRGAPAYSVEYFENAVAQEVARQAAPLPKVEIREAETLTVTHGRNEKAESLTHVARRHAEAGIAFGERPATPSLCVVPSGPDVRLLPQGGSERPGDLRGGNGGSPERVQSGSG